MLLDISSKIKHHEGHSALRRMQPDCGPCFNLPLKNLSSLKFTFVDPKSKKQTKKHEGRSTNRRGCRQTVDLRSKMKPNTGKDKRNNISKLP